MGSGSQCEQGLGAMSVGEGDDDPPDESDLVDGSAHAGAERGKASTGGEGPKKRKNGDFTF